MKYLLAVVVACTLLFAQANQKAYIYGNIIDAETLEPIPYANIFLANSSIGTASDRDGFFALMNLPSGRYEIIASVLGYELLKINVHLSGSSTRNFRFEMYKEPIEMEEVIVKGKQSWKRRRYLDYFRRNFLGSSENGKKSYITNEEVIKFEEKGEVLYAYAYEPLEIINNGLGYKIYYVLDEYQQTQDACGSDSCQSHVLGKGGPGNGSSRSSARGGRRPRGWLPPGGLPLRERQLLRTQTVRRPQEGSGKPRLGGRATPARVDLRLRRFSLSAGHNGVHRAGERHGTEPGENRDAPMRDWPHER